MRALAPLLVLTLFTTAAPALAAEPCGARADCPSAQHCLEGQCVSDVTFDRVQTEATREKALEGGARGYLGVALGGVLPAASWAMGVGVRPATHGGLLYRGFQLEVEVSPATALFGLTAQPLYAFDVGASVGYLAPLSDMVSWVLRAGGGGGFLANGACGYPPCTTATAAFGEFHAVLSGAAIRTSEHLLVELDVPAFHMRFLPGGTVLAMWVTALKFDYVF